MSKNLFWKKSKEEEYIVDDFKNFSREENIKRFVYDIVKTYSFKKDYFDLGIYTDKVILKANEIGILDKVLDHLTIIKLEEFVCGKESLKIIKNHKFFNLYEIDETLIYK